MTQVVFRTWAVSRGYLFGRTWWRPFIRTTGWCCFRAVWAAEETGVLSVEGSLAQVPHNAPDTVGLGLNPAPEAVPPAPTSHLGCRRGCLDLETGDAEMGVVPPTGKAYHEFLERVSHDLVNLINLLGHTGYYHCIFVLPVLQAPELVHDLADLSSGPRLPVAP